jgi:RNA polymerase sigma factor (sigma-70 family)
VGQETFIRFHRAIDRFRGESSLKTYLVHIAMNLSINALRRRKRSFLRFVSRDESPVDTPELRPGPADEVDSGEIQQIVRRACCGCFKNAQRRRPPTSSVCRKERYCRACRAR